VIALEHGTIACDGTPEAFLAWAADSAPVLQTPAARMFELAGLRPLPTGVRQARSALRAAGRLPAVAQPPAAAPSPAPAEPADAAARPAKAKTKASAKTNAKAKEAPALHVRGVWHELRDGPAILRGVELRVQAGETVALMGRNGAGKSTLLRHAAGLLEPTRGRVERAGRVALLLQNPGDYFIHERAREEAPADALAAVGLLELAERNPRDLSGGERQRLALAIVTAGEQPPAVLALDEPTRGMDRAARAALVAEVRRRAAAGQAVLIATHDPEFAAACAARAVLLADGRVVADGSAAELLAGGWYFATETARILGGADGALLPEQGAELLLRAGATTHAERPARRADAAADLLPGAAV
jgi:energy-coupling factor transport system ATP-binding protein